MARLATQRIFWKISKLNGTSSYHLEYKNTEIKNETKELQNSSEYYNEDVIGGKTGFTSNAGQTKEVLNHQNIWMQEHYMIMQ